MDFEKYDPEKHEEAVPEFFSEVVREPEDFGKLKEAVEHAFDDVKEVIGMKADFDVIIGSTDMEKLKEEVPEGLYFRGYSLGKAVHGHADRNAIFLSAPSDYEYWEAGLKNMAVHEEAHQEFFEHKRDLDHVVWESMVLEGHALLREEKVREQKSYKWKGDPRSYEGSAEEVLEVLDKNREWQGERYDRENTSSIFSMDSHWEGIGYVIAREVYRDVIGHEDMGVDEPLERDNEWLRDQVENSIKRLY
jgi:hypothetical protein